MSDYFDIYPVHLVNGMAAMESISSLNGKSTCLRSLVHIMHIQSIALCLLFRYPIQILYCWSSASLTIQLVTFDS